MPIYEYQPQNPERSCPRCRQGIEVLHLSPRDHRQTCPSCGAPLRRVISRVGVVIKDASPADRQVEGQIRGYEQEGKWSHAAELADKQAEAKGDSGLKERAMNNYKKAGYDPA